MTVFDDAYAYFKNNPDELAYMWTRFNWTYPPPKPFLEFVFHGSDYVAWYEGKPPPARLRVKTLSSLNVRSAAKIADNIITTLAKGVIIEVYQIKEAQNWYKIASGQYAGNYIHSQYTEVYQ